MSKRHVWAEPGQCFFTHRALKFRARAACRCAVFFIALVCFGGCAVLDPGPAPVQLQLSPEAPGRLYSNASPRQLVVAIPISGSDIDSENIAVLMNGRELRFLSGVKWIDPVPFMVQRQLITAIDAVGGLKGVSDESTGLLADARLLVEIHSFGFAYTDEKAPPSAVIEATARLVNLNSGKMLGTRSLSVHESATGNDNNALAAAMEMALTNMYAQVAPWAVDAVRRVK